MTGRSQFVSVGVQRRNARLTSLRELVPVDAAIVGIDLADDKQALVVADHDARVLDRRMVRGNVWRAIAALPWAEQVAREAGFERIVLACEPTGSRWKPLLQHARDSGLELLCVNPMLVARGREGEDYTRERGDYRDGAIIARLTSERRCFRPYQPEGAWARSTPTPAPGSSTPDSAPRANESGNYQGQTRTSGRGRPRLRTAAWRVIWRLLPHNPIYAARYTHPLTRARNPLNDGQARTALAAALLRQLFVMITTHNAWNPAIAGGKDQLLDAA